MLKNIFFVVCICFQVFGYAQPVDLRNSSQVYRDKERKVYNDAYLEGIRKTDNRPVDVGFGVDKVAVEQLVEKWKNNSANAGRLTWAEAEAARRAAEPARKAQELKEQKQKEEFNKLKAKWVAQDAAREPARAPIRQRFRDAGFTAEEAQAFGVALAIDPATGYRMVKTNAEAAQMEAAFIAKRSFDKELNLASFEKLHGYIQKFYFAGESSFMALWLLRDRFPEKSGEMLFTELASIGYILGGCYDFGIYLGDDPAGETKVAARTRFWELFDIAPAETIASSGKYSQEESCPLIYEMNLLREEYKSYCCPDNKENRAKKAAISEKLFLMQDVLIRIKFNTHSDGSIKSHVTGIREAGYDIANDKKRFLSYSNEDWISIGAAQRKSAQDMVRYVIWSRGNKEAEMIGNTIIKRLEKAGIK
jgi:hypothetical protein